jgi:hypothetical protein
MAFSPGQLAIVCLAGSLGFGGFWSKVRSSPEAPLSVVTVEPLAVDGSAGMEEASSTSTQTAPSDGLAFKPEDKEDLLHLAPAEDAVQVQVPAHMAPLVAAVQSDAPLLQAVADVSDVSPTAWWIIASFSIDCLFLLLGWHRCSCLRRRQDDATAADTSEDDGISESEAEPEVFAEEVVRDLGDMMQQCAEVGEASAHQLVASECTEGRDATEVSLPAAKAPRRRSAGELKDWMQKQRDQCEIVENMQELVVTDAKASQSLSEVASSPQHAEAGHSDEAPALDVAPPKRRNALDLKALMEKKRDQCHVLESAQEHVNTDAKATRDAIKLDVSALTQSNGRDGKELKDLMSKLRNQREISSSTRESAAADPESKGHVVNSLPVADKENVGSTW